MLLFLQVFFNQLICCYHSILHFPARRAWLDRDKSNRHIRQLISYHFKKNFKPVSCHFSGYCIRRSYIILATIDYNLFWLIRKNNFIRIPNYIWQSRTTKATINDGMIWKSSFYIFPHSERRATDKEYFIFWRERNSILLFKSGYFIGKWLSSNICYSNNKAN